MAFSYYGTNGSDRFDYRGDSLIAQGYGGNDTILSDFYDDIIYGGSGSDRLWSYGGNDLLVGGSGNDSLNGGSGDDILRGFYGGYSQEIDTLVGGQGVDIFMLGDKTGAFYLGGRNSSNRDASYGLIKDWNPQADAIQLHGSASSYRLVQNRNWFGSSANDTGIYVGNDLIGIVQDSTNVNLRRDVIFV
jgi:Ca2+-binding RTX toxin-like protein